MGGGGGFGGYRSINHFSHLVSESESSQQDIEKNEFLEGLLKEFNDRDTEAIQKHLQEIEKAIGREIEGIDQILFGGSLSKHTFIEGASDVDALVILDRSKYKEITPKELQNSFYQMLKRRFPNTEIERGTLAVTVKFKDYEVQLLPAIKNGDKIQIACNDGSKWSTSINSTAFTKKLTAVNQNNNKKVVPVIKLAKSLLSNLPEKYKLSGYHIEALAVDAFATYNGRYTLNDMTQHFLSYSAKRILSPMNDVTGQSDAIDIDFGISNSIVRQSVSGYLKDIATRFSGSVDEVKEMFK